jgi:hypothetical protein
MGCSSYGLLEADEESEEESSDEEMDESEEEEERAKAPTMESSLSFLLLFRRPHPWMRKQQRQTPLASGPQAAVSGH